MKTGTKHFPLWPAPEDRCLGNKAKQIKCKFAELKIALAAAQSQQQAHQEAQEMDGELTPTEIPPFCSPSGSWHDIGKCGCNKTVCFMLFDLLIPPGSTGFGSPWFAMIIATLNETSVT